MTKNQETQELYLPNHCLIPLEVRQDQELPAELKIYLGEINILMNKFGYCFASDVQLAKMKGVSVSTIERWHSLAEKNGHISRDTKNIPYKDKETDRLRWKPERKIYMGKAPSKKDCETPKDEGLNETPKNKGLNETPKNKGRKEEQRREHVNDDDKGKDFSKNIQDKVTKKNARGEEYTVTLNEVHNHIILQKIKCGLGDILRAWKKFLTSSPIVNEPLKYIATIIENQKEAERWKMKKGSASKKRSSGKNSEKQAYQEYIQRQEQMKLQSSSKNHNDFLFISEVLV